ncbi:MAG: amidohydrolase family protein [Dehalococcoidia bacterium]|nr:amidohydrolase family protein [Dehalococcoidia bacterium]
MIWDVHCHFPRNWDPSVEVEADELLARRADALRSAGVTRASLLCGGRFGLPYEESIAMARRHEDLFVPSAMVDPDEITGRDVRRLHEMGYRGLKIIGTRRDYDDRRYFTVYEAAELLRMPILFHLGVIGGGVDYSITHPRRDAQAAQTMQRMRDMGRNFLRDVSAIRMRPFHLDTIANNFPDLRIIGAHLGGTGNYDEAASVARWRHNVLFDMSGGVTIERHAMDRDLIGKEIGVEKLVWGSDCQDHEIAEHVKRFEILFDQLRLTDDQTERMWYRNAAELFGEAEPTTAVE